MQHLSPIDQYLESMHAVFTERELLFRALRLWPQNYFVVTGSTQTTKSTRELMFGEQRASMFRLKRRGSATPRPSHRVRRGRNGGWAYTRVRGVHFQRWEKGRRLPPVFAKGAARRAHPCCTMVSPVHWMDRTFVAMGFRGVLQYAPMRTSPAC